MTHDIFLSLFFSSSTFLWIFEVLLLLSAHVQRFSFSCMLNLFVNNKKFLVGVQKYRRGGEGSTQLLQCPNTSRLLLPHDFPYNGVTGCCMGNLPVPVLSWYFPGTFVVLFLYFPNTFVDVP